MDIKYPIENKYMKCVLQINGFSGLRPRVWSSRQVGLDRGARQGEPRLVENISYKGYSILKCTCIGHVPHIHIYIPSKNMQFLLWNPTCHALK